MEIEKLFLYKIDKTRIFDLVSIFVYKSRAYYYCRHDIESNISHNLRTQQQHWTEVLILQYMSHTFRVIFPVCGGGGGGGGGDYPSSGRISRSPGRRRRVVVYNNRSAISVRY